jgi:hypothetical protein
MEKDKSIIITELFWSLLSAERVSFTLKLRLDRIRKNVSVKYVNWKTKKLVLNTGESFPLADINTLGFIGENAKDFRKKILPDLKEYGSYFKFAEGKEVLFYPFGEKKILKTTLLKEYPYFFILEKERNFIVKSKNFISAFALEHYPLISGNIEVYEFPSTSWRDTRKELLGYLREISKKKKKVTLALKDGREISGYISKASLTYGYFNIRLFDSLERRISITTFWHAVDDLWEDAE